MNELLNRQGRVEISLDEITFNPEMVMAIMGEMIVTHALTHWPRGVIEYVAISPHFDEIDEGNLAPMYTVIIHVGKDHRMIDFIRQDA